MLAFSPVHSFTSFGVGDKTEDSFRQENLQQFRRDERNGVPEPSPDADLYGAAGP